MASTQATGIREEKERKEKKKKSKSPKSTTWGCPSAKRTHHIENKICINRWTEKIDIFQCPITGTTDGTSSCRKVGFTKEHLGTQTNPASRMVNMLKVMEFLTYCYVYIVQQALGLPLALWCGVWVGLGPHLSHRPGIQVSHCVTYHIVPKDEVRIQAAGFSNYKVPAISTVQQEFPFSTCWYRCFGLENGSLMVYLGTPLLSYLQDSSVTFSFSWANSNLGTAASLVFPANKMEEGWE